MDRAGSIAAASLAGAALLAAFSAFATNGYFPHGWGTRSGAMAGAGSAMVEDAMIAATNPAGISALKRPELLIGLGIIKAQPGYAADPFAPPQEPLPPGAFPLDPRREKADPDVPGGVFPVPQLAAAWPLSERAVVGLAIYANGGLNATYSDFANATCPAGTAQKGVYCGGVASSDLSQVFIAPTYAYQVNDWLRAGASLILAVESLEVRGLSAFAPISQRPDRLTDHGHEIAYGYGAKLGMQVRIVEGLNAAAVAQTRVDLSSLEGYEGLLADGGEFDVPPYATLGLAWDITPQWTAAFDVQKIWYSSIPAVGNNLNSPGLLGAPDGPGFGWDDVTAYKLGARYFVNPRWTVRAGFSYTEQPVDPQQLFFNILAGSVFKKHFTAGFTRKLESGNELDFSLMWAPEQREHGPNPFYPDQQMEVSLEGVIVDFVWRGLF
jgi:long-chain fatty acid transport protein